MRIGIVSHAYYPNYGGVTENVAGSSRALVKRGHQVTIITAGANRPRQPGVERLGHQVAVRLNGATVQVALGAHLGDALTALYRRHRFDLVHVHSPLTPMLPLAAVRTARRVGLPVIGTFHASARYNWGYALFRRRLQPDFAALDGAVAVSHAARQFVQRYFDGPVQLIPNGVDTERFRALRPPVGEPLRVVFVGRLDPRKGVDLLLESFQGVRCQRPGTTLKVIGDGPCRRGLEGRAKPAGVEFLGAVPPGRLAAAYAGADAVCAPASRNESFGIVLLEAMAAGRAVVATDIAGYRDLVEHNVTGILVPPGDAQALAQALVHLADHPADRARLGDNARRQARDYDWGEIAHQLEALYRRVVDCRGPVDPQPATGLNGTAAKRLRVPRRAPGSRLA